MATSVPGMTSPDVLVRVATARGVTTLTLDSPHNRNALSTAPDDPAAGRRWRDGGRPTTAVRVIVLDHTGPVFCSGADLKETAAAYASGTVPAGMLGDVLAALWECPKPVRGPGRRAGAGRRARPDRRRRPGGLRRRGDVRVHRGTPRGDPGGDLGDRAAPAAPPRRRRAVPDRRHLRRSPGRRDRPGHGRRSRRTGWTTRSAATATRWCAARRARWPARRSCCADRAPPSCVPSWPSCPPSRPATSSPTRGARGSWRSANVDRRAGCPPWTTERSGRRRW